MIGKLKGRIDSCGPDWVIIDVGGVGYHVFCSSKTLGALPPVGEFGEIHTEMLVSQDMIRLVGFAATLERDWFRLLQTVQGVGTKVALAMLSTLSAPELANAIALQDKAMIGRAPRHRQETGRAHCAGTERQGTGVFDCRCNAFEIAGRNGWPKAHSRPRCGLGLGQSGLRPGASRCRSGGCDEEGRR